ncbi:MAG: ATP-binding protein [Methylobacter sp.]|nr:ATP-binding protein [Methylobacter sp.]MDP2099027.1 ATP-binding protein [Methylobacter sp.]MDP2427614.1 ATP-binding protein [Methylobacter sp.]MDP3056855.1 ATP-binding protein [Methylobacter sp.]MDP3363506.1 ATP-binding protein [Methylobacter sp.]
MTTQPTNASERMPILDASDIVRARGVARQVAGRIGFGLADQTRLATAVSELARNVVQYGDDGFCEIADLSDANEMRLGILVEDHGAGIDNIDKAMKDGYSTGGGLGAGLPGTRRLMDEFAIESEPGLTRVSIALVRKRS